MSDSKSVIDGNGKSLALSLERDTEAGEQQVACKTLILICTNIMQELVLSQQDSLTCTNFKNVSIPTQQIDDHNIYVAIGCILLRRDQMTTT